MLPIWDFFEIRNIVELVPWKQLVEVRPTALPASIPWLASCSPCLSVCSTLPTGTHTFMPKNPLTGTITCSKVSLGHFLFIFSAMYSSWRGLLSKFFSEPQNSKEKSQLSRLKKMQFSAMYSFFYFSRESLSGVFLTPKYIWAKIHIFPCASYSWCMKKLQKVSFL